MDGTTSPTAANPFGLNPGMQALVNSLQGMGNALSPPAANSANYARAAPQAQMSFGSPSADQLIQMILQMRQSAAQGLGDPYAAGVAAPRVSLLTG